MQSLDEDKMNLKGAVAGNDAGTLLGRLLVDQGRIKETDIESILSYARKHNLRFGEAATKLRLISSHDLEHAMSAQFDYPYLEKGAGGYSSELVAAFKPFSPKGQALRILRAQLMLRWHSEQNRALAIIGSNKKDGCSYTAANLAIVFSQLGHRTLLVDADMQHGRQHVLFNVKNDVGLSAVLIGRISVDAVIKELPLFRGLSLLPAGAPPPSSGEVLGRRELPDSVRKLCEHYDVVLFDAPPVSGNSGSEAVAGACGSALVVLRKNRTYVADSTALVQTIRDVGANIVGTVMSAF